MNSPQRFVTVSKYPHAAIANRVASALGLVGKRPVVIHSIEATSSTPCASTSMPLAAFEAPSAKAISAFRENAGLRPSSVVVSTFGRLEPEKGLETVIGLAELALHEAPEPAFVIGGACRGYFWCFWGSC